MSWLPFNTSPYDLCHLPHDRHLSVFKLLFFSCYLLSTNSSTTCDMSCETGIRLKNIVLNLKISPVQQIGRERAASVFLKGVDPRGPLSCICFPKITGVNIVSSMKEQ